MNFQNGVLHMKQLHVKMPQNSKLYSQSFQTNKGLNILYPGKKNNGDYKVELNGSTPTHHDVCLEIYNQLTEENIEDYVDFLDDIYKNGLNSTNKTNDYLKDLIFWVSLQEEINYPQPRFKGRRLAFCRYYEAILAKKGILTLNNLKSRCNNHGRDVPELYNETNSPNFYK